MTARPTPRQVRAALCGMDDDPQHTHDLAIYLSAVLYGNAEGDIADGLNRDGPPPPVAASWSREMIRVRIREARRELRRRLGLEDERRYGRYRLAPQERAERLRIGRRLRAESAALDLWVAEAMR